MYYCENCGKEFSKPCIVNIGFKENGIQILKEEKACPKCMDIDIIQSIGECDICNKRLYDIDTYYKLASGELICENCIERNE